MVCQSTSLQKQAQFDTVSKKAFNFPLLPCLNTASSPAQKVFALYLLKQKWGVETINKGCSDTQQITLMLEIEISNHSPMEIEIKLRG